MGLLLPFFHNSTTQSDFIKPSGRNVQHPEETFIIIIIIIIIIITSKTRVISRTFNGFQKVYGWCSFVKE